MIVLGLGANIGDRFATLKKALNAIRNLPDLKICQVSPLYTSLALLPENAPPEWDMPYLNLAVRIETTQSPEALLDQLKNIEWRIGRKPEIRHWGPRVLDIDILTWGSVIIETERLTVPHRNLQERPFALWPLADVAPFWIFPLEGRHHGKTAEEMVKPWGSRFTGDAPFRCRQIQQRIDTPEIMGVLNITPDSFSDGGNYSYADTALKSAIQMVDDGATILDLGAESTCPKATAITPQEEWQRLEPVLKQIITHKKDFMMPPTISIDTRHSETAAKALAAGANWINDVSGLDSPGMRDLIKQKKCPTIFMHHLSIPENRSHYLPPSANALEVVLDWGYKRIETLEKESIDKSLLIFDPGIGFGKSAAQSMSLLAHAEHFKSLGLPVLIGHSRKTYLSPLSKFDFSERDIETLAATLILMPKNIDYVRVHDVSITARGMKIQRMLEQFV